MSIPVSITAGNNLSLPVLVQEKPASAGWALKLRLVPQDDTASVITLSAIQEGDGYRFAVASGVTAAWKAGRYTCALWVERGAESLIVEQGQMQVLPDPRQAVAGFDGRTPAQKALDDARAVLLTWNPSVRRYRIFDREREFNSVSEVRRLISQLEFEVAREASGNNTPQHSGRIYFRST